MNFYFSCELTPLVQLRADPPSGRFSPSLLRPTSHLYPPPYTLPADQQETGPPYFYLTPSPRSQGVQ